MGAFSRSVDSFKETSFEGGRFTPVDRWQIMMGSARSVQSAISTQVSADKCGRAEPCCTFVHAPGACL